VFGIPNSNWSNPPKTNVIEIVVKKLNLYNVFKIFMIGKKLFYRKLKPIKE